MRPSLFRPEALAHQRARGPEAELVVLDAAATNWGFRLLCAGMLAFLVFVTLGRVNEYATGPAFVQLDGRAPLTADSAGLVSTVSVKPGDRVEAGAELVRFHAAEEIAELQAATREFDNQVAKLLLKPDDPMAREALIQLRTKRDLAQQRCERRVLRAPQSGVIGDVRVRPGQVVEPGMRVVDLQAEATAATVTALMPGRYLPLLRAGDTLRFEVDGFRHLPQELAISRVGEQIVGPAEAARFVGRDLADAIAIQGPVVLVEAALPSTHFAIDGQPYEYASGMFGKAEAIVRNEPIAYAFVPSLKQWVEQVIGTSSKQSAEVGRVH
jgi:membrane fusion protein (multidrug efflux system)